MRIHRKVVDDCFPSIKQVLLFVTSEIPFRMSDLLKYYSSLHWDMASFINPNQEVTKKN